MRTVRRSSGRRRGRLSSVRRVALAAVAAGLLVVEPTLAGAPDVGGSNTGNAGVRETDETLLPATLEPASAITFHASDGFGGFDGEAPVASFSLKLDPARPASARGSLEIRSDAVTTGNFLRNVNAARTVFDSRRYPTIRYMLEAVQAHPASLPDGGRADLTVRGRLQMHGVERDVTAHGAVSRRGGVLDVTLSLQLRLSDFDMTRPHILTVVVDDLIKLHVHLLLRLDAAQGG